MSAETAAILDEAAEVIRRNGWFQGYYFDPRRVNEGHAPEDCAVCARGAINIAAGAAPTNDFFPGACEAAEAVENWLVAAGCVGEEAPLSVWNDEPGRTADDVLAALEGAAKAERERAS